MLGTGGGHTVPNLKTVGTLWTRVTDTVLKSGDILEVEEGGLGDGII